MLGRLNYEICGLSYGRMVIVLASTLTHALRDRATELDHILSYLRVYLRLSWFWHRVC
jgi:hypothetical protein